MPALLVVLQSPTRNAQITVFFDKASSAGIFTLNGQGSGDGAIVNTLTATTDAFSPTTANAPTYLALFVTSLDTTVTPTVWIGGIAAPVQYSGFPGTYPGMQQINVVLPTALAGAGRVEVVTEQNGRRSNAVEIVALPQPPVFANDQPNQTRTRELAAVAWVPGTSLALVADENDDVVRVLDLVQRRVTHVIALPSGARPAALGVHGSGTMALVAERGRNSVALLSLTAFNVTAEYPVGISPSAIAVATDQAVIANSDDDTVSFFSFRSSFGFPSLQVTATVAAGRLPRAIGVDASNAYVTNESAGTISVISLRNHAVVNTLSLGTDVRPTAIQVLSDQGVAVVAEPSAGPGGKLIFVKLANGQLTSIQANPDQTGGASSMAAIGDQLYLANQSGGSITTTPVAVQVSTQLVPANIQVSTVNFKVGLGPRSIDVDSKDNLLLVANEGAGTVSVVNLTNNNVVGTIDALRSSPSDIDNNADRLAAPNMPVITSISPSTAASPSTVTLTITGTNLNGTSGILLLDSNSGTFDPALAVSNIQVSANGTQITAQVQVPPNTPPRTRAVRVLTPNGETSLLSAPSFSVVGTTTP